MFWNKEARRARKVKAIKTRLDEIANELAAEQSRVSQAFDSIVVGGRPSATDLGGATRVRQLQQEAEMLEDKLSALET